MNNFDFKNKTAIITGGAQGFGLDIAKKFLKFGANVRIWDNDEGELIEAVKKENNKNLEYDVVDITKFDLVEKTIKKSNILIIIAFIFVLYFSDMFKYNTFFGRL